MPPTTSPSTTSLAVSMAIPYLPQSSRGLFDKAINDVVDVTSMSVGYDIPLFSYNDQHDSVAIGGRVSLIGHSAGGWLACSLYGRIWFLGDLFVIDSWPPPKGLPGVIDQTRGLLDYVEKQCTKAVYTPQFKYVLYSPTMISMFLFLHQEMMLITVGTTAIDRAFPTAITLGNKQTL
ncbi:hypothetical protein QYF36_025250 [Acer negundo]|nr:hypothetical protein QYF36_025250 [Acer negundo]